jgi:hypothetical protein
MRACRVGRRVNTPKNDDPELIEPNATLWRLEDDADGGLAFEIAVFKSLAQSFWQALSYSAGQLVPAVTLAHLFRSLAIAGCQTARRRRFPDPRDREGGLAGPRVYCKAG